MTLSKLLIQCLVNCGKALVLFLEKIEEAPRFEMDFALDLTMCSADFICVNGFTIQQVFRDELLTVFYYETDGF